MTTVTVIGHLDEFHMGKDDFNCYIRRMEQYFVANVVPEERNKLLRFSQQSKAQLMNSCKI